MRSRLAFFQATAPSYAFILRTIVAAALAFPLSAAAQPRPTRPDVPETYVIRDARVVTVAGRTLDRASVVVANGVITAVGADVAVPEGAWVIDGKGRTVYPGLIDAMTTLGHPAARPARSGGGMGPFSPQTPVDPSTHSWGPEDRPATHSGLSAGEGLDGTDPRIAQWREAGFTTVMSTRDEGLVTGQAAVLDLGRFAHPREMVVATPVAMHLKLQDRTHTGYPNSLFGSFAYLKQLYMDAAHYQEVWDAYRADPAGKRRPEWDPALEPIVQELNDGWPVLFPADDRKEIARAVTTAQVLGVRPVVYGAQGAWAAADVLAQAQVPALVSLDWPKAAANGDPEADVSLATLRLWDRAPTTPAVLSKAGVSFAFTSGGLTDPADALVNARRAVAMGLSKDAAIRAFTLDAARILGVDDRLGSIEAGKVANLVLTSGDLFEDGATIESVFVDGARFEIAPKVAATPARGGRRQAGATTYTEPVPMVKDRGAFRDDPITLIRNATVMTATGETLENASVLVRNGKIAEVGVGIAAPSGAHVVDATGKWVTPGIIDAHSHIATDAVNEGSINVSSMVAIQDVINPDDPNIYWALAGGVTTVQVLHGSANPIGGTTSLIKLRWGADAPELLFDAEIAGLKLALGENVKRDRNPDRYPATRMGVMDVIRQAFLDAQEYQRGWDAWEAGGSQGVAPRRDLKLEPLVEVMQGKRLAHVHAYRAEETLQMMRLAEEFGFRVRSFEHELEGYRIADELAEHGAGATTFSDWWGYKVEAYEAIPYNAALMEERGVLVTINSDSGEEMRHLNQEAAKTMKWGGVSRENALRMVTRNSAMQLGVDARTGTLEVGKDADIAVFDGDPLSMYAKVVQTYVDGTLYFDRDLDRERQEAIQRERTQLLERHGPRAAGERVTADRVAPMTGSAGEVIR